MRKVAIVLIDWLTEIVSAVRNFRDESHRTGLLWSRPMKAMSQRSDPFFRSALWIIVISWVTLVLLVFAFYFSVLLLNWLFQH